VARFACPVCGRAGPVKDEYIGRKIACPGCKSRVRLVGDGVAELLPPKETAPEPNPTTLVLPSEPPPVPTATDRWWISGGGHHTGPLTLEELRAQPFGSDTLIWKPGLSAWVRPKEVSELADLAREEEPPPVPALPERSWWMAAGPERKGPMTLEELRAQTFEPGALVWRPGMPAWARLAEAPETADLVRPESPPPLPARTAPRSRGATAVVTVIVLLLVLGCIGSVAYFLGRSDGEIGRVIEDVRRIFR
jgi:hypothetical protein